MLNINRLAALVAASVIIVGSAGCQSASTESANESISGGSGSTEAAAAAATPAVAAEKQRPKVICKSERVTGSHMRERVCRTAEDIAERRENDQRVLRDTFSTGGGSNN